jgi:arabinose-5-phosphate isomerase
MWSTVWLLPAQAKRLTQEEYAMNHPAGRIGRRLVLRVCDVMLSGPALPLVQPGTRIVEVRPCGSAVV